jgi:hypothetical protein
MAKAAGRHRAISMATTKKPSCKLRKKAAVISAGIRKYCTSEKDGGGNMTLGADEIEMMNTMTTGAIKNAQPRNIPVA